MKFAANTFATARLGLVASDLQAGSGGTDGTGIDFKGFDECLVIVNSGTNTSTGSLDVIVEECATVGGTYAAVSGAVFTQILAANDNTIYQGRIDLRKRMRFLRINAVGDGSNAAIASVSFIALNPNQGPAVATNTNVFDV